MIDAQNSFWELSKVQESQFLDNVIDDPLLRRDFLLPELEDELDFSGVDQVVSVQLARSNSENQFLLEEAKKSDGLVAGVVGWAPLASDDINVFLDQYSFEPLMKGYREVVDNDTKEQYLENLDFDRGLVELTRRDLSFDLMATTELLPEVIAFTDRHPNQRIVINNGASPDLNLQEIPADWARNIRELARRPHLFCQLSGLNSPIRHNSHHLKPYFEILVNAFTPERLMMASDWPLCKKRTTYQEWLNVNDDFVHELSQDEQKAIRRETAVQFYKL